MDIQEIVITAIIEKTTEKIIDSISKLHKSTPSKKQSKSIKLSDSAMKIAIKQAFNFATLQSSYKSATQTHTLDSTIELTLSKSHRRFGKSNKSNDDTNEIGILHSKNSTLIMGDPGSGKTTTLKRLLSKHFNALLGEQEHDLKYSFPILVRLAELQPDECLCSHICQLIGIEYTKEPYTIIDHVEEFNIETQQFEIVKKEITKYKHKISGIQAELAISEIFDSINTIIYLDALDELHYTIKNDVFDEIVKISQSIQNSKIILTARLMDETTKLHNFDKITLEKLSSEQSVAIANILNYNYKDFFNKIRNKPYVDLIDRPLFLCLLLKLFDSMQGEMPNLTLDIYRNTILLVIEEWDKQKSITPKRYSIYKQFDRLKKAEFLSYIAYDLIYSETAIKAFNYPQLQRSYSRIYKNFPELEQENPKDVISDIETHNGLIIQLDTGFEFSHLSLQEYLSAQYITKTTKTRDRYRKFNQYPDCFAIATAISATSTLDIAELILANIHEISIPNLITKSSIVKYFNRLIAEHVQFTEPNDAFGIALLTLFEKFNIATEHESFMPRLLKIRFVDESMRLGLNYYEKYNTNPIKTTLKKKISAPIPNIYAQYPDKIILPTTIYNKYKK